MSKEIQQAPEQASQNAQMPQDFLTLSSIQSLRLLFSIRQNFEPLFRIMENAKDFEDFLMKYMGKSFEEVMKGGK